VIDDLQPLEESFGATLKLALHRAAEAVDVGTQAAEEALFVTVLSEPAKRRTRRPFIMMAAAAVLLVAITGAIVLGHDRRAPATHSAVEVAPGWVRSSEGPIGVRTGGVFVWDGAGVVLWGGASYDKALHLLPAVADGAVYDAASDTWTTINNAPIAGRRSAKAVWTGARVVIWGGIDDQGAGLRDGALFDPASGEWTTMAAAPAGVAAAGSAAVWTGSEMLVWGGPAGSKGAAFDPTSNSWRALPDAPIASRPIETATWTEVEMVVWSDGDGAAYNPVIDTWRAMAPSPMQDAKPRGVWTGSDVVFLGGADTGGLSESAAYHPVTDSWQMLAPGPQHPGLGFEWTGTTIVGVVKGVVVDYEPITDRWTESVAKIDAIPFGTWADDRYVFVTDDGTSKVRVAFYQPPDTLPKDPLPTYDLALASARLTNDEVGISSGYDAATWAADDGTYLSLGVIPREPGGPKGFNVFLAPISTFPAARGKAWYGEQTSRGGAVSSILWWEHPDQSVWLMNAHWYGAAPPSSAQGRQDRFVQWALDVTTPAASNYELNDPGMQLVGHERQGTHRTRVRTWSYGGKQIALVVTENASGTELEGLLGRGVPQSTTIQSRVGSQVTDDGGDVTVGWKVDDLGGAWATLSIPSALAGQTDDIVHSLRLVG
jgi:hypothetical protein